MPSLHVSRLGLTALPTLLATAAHAHEGHGLLGAHWHATDVLGFIGLAVAVGAAIWFTRK
ncbi:hypothetical protein [Tepidicella baoligensis]|uniref:hypothetical protein n=1 Tax=Tepidicella baoligensis TaxID=2707016 RepID=UPI0015DB1AC2|nr:hypothetical protein [Tepidicella baoligensis]